MEEIILIALGLVIGSFLNVVIHRMPLEQSIVKPGSHCPQCNTPVKSYDNIPVLSYIILMGKCRNCKAHISIQYPAVELFTAFSFWLSYIYFAPAFVHVGFTALFLAMLIALALIDLKHMILPLEITIGGAVIFLVYSFFNPLIGPVNAFSAAFGSALLFAAIYFFYIKVRKIEGLGQGDIWMVLMLGAYLGLNKLVVAVLVASFSGAIVGVFLMIVQKKGLKHEIPFGTFLSFGSFISLFWGAQILKFIQNIYKI
jgi:leader peptidase (prepilin peptidase) / N-methyltransferase